mmetsp:Transcript_61509/g.71873  ORF Transcript_61509/g.71873 Transcript_61509/m.71873 type:complete len:231 (+) Transcript_61509:264-956(+)
MNALNSIDIGKNKTKHTFHSVERNNVAVMSCVIFVAFVTTVIAGTHFRERRYGNNSTIAGKDHPPLKKIDNDEADKNTEVGSNQRVINEGQSVSKRAVLKKLPSGENAVSYDATEIITASSNRIKFPWEPSLESDEHSSNARESSSVAPLVFVSPSTIAGTNEVMITKNSSSGTKCKDKTFEIKQKTKLPAYTKKQQNIITQHEKEQLSFLSSMTFASGGLRSPSCPCCQ